MPFPALSGQNASVAMLMAAAVAGYIASRAAVAAITPPGESAPGRRAVVHAFMVAVVAIAAIIRQPVLLDVAVGVPFSAAVAAVTLTLGIVVFVALPTDGLRVVETSPQITRKRLWAFVLPTALLTVLVGFGAQITGRHACILALEGLALLLVWLGMNPPAATDPDRDPDSLTWVVQLVLALALAAVAGIAAVEAAAGLAGNSPVFRPGVAAVLCLGPAIVLPMTPPLASLSETGRRDEAISAIVLFVLINLCGILPAVVAVRALQAVIHPVLLASTTQPVQLTNLLPFPMTVWRLDAVLLVVVGLLLVPAALGRWSLSRVEGLGLVVLYIGYLFVTLLLSHGG